MEFDLIPLWILAPMVVGIPTIAAMLGVRALRRYVGLERLSANNEVAGFKFATVGVIYAVLLAFAVIVVWERFSAAEDHVAAEAGAAASLYRLIEGIDSESRVAIRKQLTAYLESAIDQDWPAMEHGRPSDRTTRALDALYAATLAYKPTDLHGAMLMEETLRQLNALTEARRARIVKSVGAVPGLLWFVLFVGAFVTIGFTLFFGNRDVHAQTLMTGALVLLIFSGLLVIVAINHPFSGAVKVHPEPLIEVLTEIGRVKAPGH